MGYVETYCFICGGPLRNNGTKVKNIDLLRKATSNIKVKIGNRKTGKSTYLYVREICLEHILDNFEYYKKYYKISKDDIIKLYESQIDLSKIKKYYWLNELLFLHKSGDIIPVKYWDTYYSDGKFIDVNNNIYITGRLFYGKLKDYISKYKKKQLDIYDPKSEKYHGDGYVMHKNCYKLLTSKYGKFNFNNIYLGDMDYKFIAQYKTQFNPPWLDYFINNDDYLLENPLKNNKNKIRILNLKHPIKKSTEEQCIKSTLKKYKNRPSPAYPAKLCKNKKLKGNDGNTWISAPNKKGIYRWKKLVDNKQTGGTNYYYKYIKYKKKYINLKKNTIQKGANPQ